MKRVDGKDRKPSPDASGNFAEMSTPERQERVRRAQGKHEDAQVREGMKPLLDLYYRALLRSGKSEDEALDRTAAEERRMWAEWEAARRTDGA